MLRGPKKIGPSPNFRSGQDDGTVYRRDGSGDSYWRLSPTKSGPSPNGQHLHAKLNPHHHPED
jgi:hypothetical protein